MRRDIRHALAVFAAVAGASLTGDALATSQRTFVASTGLDTNACSLSAPCRSFAAAITKTSTNGEVIVLDSAGYGPVTIAKSISLIAPPGVYAGVTVFSSDGITVNAPGIIVVLRGLSINGQGGQNGINLLQAARLRIENCVISSMTGDGILHAANGAEVVVLDTIIRDNLGNGLDILADTSIVLDHVRSEHNLFDGISILSLSNTVAATISDSLFVFNGRHGISVATSVPSSTPRVMVDRSVLADNVGSGFVLNGANAHSVGTLTRNSIHRNGGDGVSVLGGFSAETIVSVYENTISGNANGIRADGSNLAIVEVSGNTMSAEALAYKQANSASFRSYGNNVGVYYTSGTIYTVSGK
ncbi:MAG: right-handed parallel beta-helix repeat-containing protein [Casimicrobiaceae bacterium]